MDKEVPQGSVQNQNVDLPLRCAPITECACVSRSLHKVHCSKNYVRQNQRLPTRRAATSQIQLRRFKVKLDMSKSTNKYEGVLVNWGGGYELFL